MMGMVHRALAQAAQRSTSQWSPASVALTAAFRSEEGACGTHRAWSAAPQASEAGAQSIKAKGIELQGVPTYLDMQATTPLDPRVLDRMLPYWTTNYGNPHSRTHLYGWESEDAVEEARKSVANLIVDESLFPVDESPAAMRAPLFPVDESPEVQCVPASSEKRASPREIVFTSGATESNNLAIKGVANFYKEKKRHLITTQTEHKCVLDSCRVLQQQGFEVTYLPVDSQGLVSIDDLKAAIRPDTVLVSVMYVNNEIGVIQPMDEIGKICRENKIFLHTDAAQAVGKIPVDVNATNIDLMSISGHKLYGPKGIGAIYVRRRPRVRLEPQMSGGGQERGLRSGTVPTPLVVGLGAACDIAFEIEEHMQEMAADRAHVEKLEKRLREGIMSQCEHVQLNGPLDYSQRYPGNVNLSFAYVEGESLLMGLREIAVSSGSACTSASLEPSYVLRALGVDEEMAHTSIRFGIGRFSTTEEVDVAIQQTVERVGKLREMSPLWDMVQDGIDLKTIQWSQH